MATAAADPIVAAKTPPTGKRALISVLLLAALAFPLLQFAVGGMNYWLHMLLFIFMNIAIASSWNIIGGYAGYISLGHNVFFAIGGYAAAILFAYFGVSPFIAVRPSSSPPSHSYCSRRSSWTIGIISAAPTASAWRSSNCPSSW
jgi:ABC-type branched-subunit amino acid transport system permease subunit